MSQGDLPRPIAKKIMERAAKGEGAIVVVIKGGKPSRVYGFEKYEERKQLTKQVRPWERRKRAKNPDPLGAVEGTVVAPIRREEIYE